LGAVPWASRTRRRFGAIGAKALGALSQCAGKAKEHCRETAGKSIKQKKGVRSFDLTP